MWCKNNGCCNYDKENNKCKLPLCWMETSEYNGRFLEEEKTMKEIMEKDFTTREVELYNLINFKNIDVKEVKEIEKVFDKQGHSGFSASYVIGYLKLIIKDFETTNNKLKSMLVGDEDGFQQLIYSNIMEIYNMIKDKDKEFQDIIMKLLDMKPLTPIMDGEDQWDNVGDGMYQNKRCSAVFKKVFSNGLEIPFYLYDKVYSSDGGITTHTSVRYGRYEITFPFTPPEYSEEVFVHIEEDGENVYYLSNPETIQKLKEISKNENIEEPIEEHRLITCTTPENDFIETEIELYNSENSKNIDCHEVTGIISRINEESPVSLRTSFSLQTVRLLLSVDYEKASKKLDEFADNNDYVKNLIVKGVHGIYDELRQHSKEIQDICLKLLNNHPLTPISDTDEQWISVNNGLYQHKRCNDIYKQFFDNGLEINYYAKQKLYSYDGGLTFVENTAHGKYEIQFPFTVPDTSETVYVYNDFIPYYLSNPETINKLKELSLKETDNLFSNISNE